MLLELGAAAFVGYAGLPTLWMRFTSPGTLRRGPAAQREVALTFDDGPDPVYTPRVLKALAEADVKATFFMLGMKAARYPGVARAVVEAGHEVGSHMYHHRLSWFLGPVATERELRMAERAITTATGKPPTCFRPPWGAFSAAMLPPWHFHGRLPPPVVWSVHPGDWRPRITPQLITSRILRHVRPGSIILLHDGAGYPGNPSAMVAALPDVLAGLKAQGYQLVPLSHWFGSRSRRRRVAQAPVEPLLSASEAGHA